MSKTHALAFVQNHMQTLSILSRLVAIAVFICCAGCSNLDVFGFFSEEDSSEEEDIALLAALGGAVVYTDAVSGTCTGTSVGAVALSETAAEYSIAGTGDARVFSDTVPGSRQRTYILYAYDVSVGLDVSIDFCNQTFDRFGSTDNRNGAGGAEVSASRVTVATDSGLIFISVSGVGVGTFRFDAEDISAFSDYRGVSGGGSCTGFDGALTSECLDFDFDFLNSQVYCTSTLGGTYFASACSASAVEGECSSGESSSSGGGIVTYVGYTADFASDSLLQSHCDARYPAYVYESTP